MPTRIAFGLSLIAAALMLGLAALMGVAAPPCHPLPMSTLTAFELARSAGDLQRIFGAAGEACRAPVALQLDHANLLDAAGYIPAYAAFYALVLYGLGRRDRALGWTGVAIILLAAVADWVEDAALFRLSAAPDAPGSWLSVLIASTNLKWVGLAVAMAVGGLTLLRRGGLGWIGLIACAAPLVSSLWAVAAPDAAGKWLIPGMAVASVMLLLVAVTGAFAKDPAPDV